VKTGRVAIGLAVLLLAGGTTALSQTTWITTVVDPIGGASISPEYNMEPFGSGGTFNFTITPSPGWSLNTVEVYHAADEFQPLVLESVKLWAGTKTRTLSYFFDSGVYEIRVHAQLGTWYLVAVDITGPGSVTFSPEGEPPPDYIPNYWMYENGTEVTLEAIPDSGCVFAGWDDGTPGGWTSTDNPLVITVSGSGWGANANFEEGPPPLTITASAGGGGTIAPSGAVLVAPGDDQTFTITPAPNHTIADVVVDGVSVGAVGTYTFTTVDVDHTIEAAFSAAHTWITTVVDPIGGASISPEYNMEPFGSGGTFNFTITPSPGWSLNTVEVYHAADEFQPLVLESVKLWAGTKTRTLSYFFDSGVYEIRVHAQLGTWYLVAVDITGPGSVTFSPEGEPPPDYIPNYWMYENGTEVTLEAIPDSGCVFAGWDDGTPGGWTSTDNPLVITVSGSGWGANASFQEVPCTAPLVAESPSDLAKTVWESAAFSVTIEGTPLLSYQWRKDGVEIPGATDSSYVIESVQVTDAGSYDAVVTNACGSATSEPATLVVNKANATIHVNGYSGVYDGIVHGAVGTATGVHGEDLSAGLDLGGTFADVPGGVAHWTFAGGADYNDASGDAAIVIGKANATIVVTPYSVFYDGLPHTATGIATGVLGTPLGGLDLGGTTHTNRGDYAADPWTFTDGTGNYNGASETVHDVIAAKFNGLLPPYKERLVVKLGSVMPLKWQYTDAFGAVLNSAGAGPVISIFGPFTVMPEDLDDLTPITLSDAGQSGLRYDLSTKTWQYNWQTKGLGAGRYLILIAVDESWQAAGPMEIVLAAK